MEFRIVNIKGKDYRIPLDTIIHYQKSLDISEEEAIQMWLDDREITTNDEVEELTKKAKANGTDKIVVQSQVKKAKTERKPKENPLKKDLIANIFQYLAQNDKIKEVKIENPTKLITFKVDNKEFKLDLIEKRAKK